MRQKRMYRTACYQVGSPSHASQKHRVTVTPVWRSFNAIKKIKNKKGGGATASGKPKTHHEESQMNLIFPPRKNKIHTHENLLRLVAHRPLRVTQAEGMLANNQNYAGRVIIKMHAQHSKAKKARCAIRTSTNRSRRPFPHGASTPPSQPSTLAL